MKPAATTSVSDVDHRSAIASLGRDRREALLGKSDLAGLRHLAGHVAALALSSTLIVAGGWWRWPALVVQGVLIVFLFTALHETAHRTPFRTRWLNAGVGRVCGLLVFVAPIWFRYFHLEHHRYTNQPGRDPELAGEKPTTPAGYLLYLTGVPETFQRFRMLLCNAVRVNQDRFVPANGKRAVQREAQLQLGVYSVLVAGSIALQTTLLLWLWIVPFMLGAPFLRAYLLAEHSGCVDDPSMFRNTRTVLTNPVVRFVAWNMPFHAEHHAFPAVPFHKLRNFHEHVRDHVAVTEPGYARFTRHYLQMTGD